MSSIVSKLNNIGKIVANNCRMALRRLKTYSDKLQKSALENNVNPSPPTSSKENISENTEKILKILDKHLPQRESQAIIMKYREDMSNKEVAKKLGINERSVSRYVSMGLSKVRQILSLEGGQTGE